MRQTTRKHFNTLPIGRTLEHMVGRSLASPLHSITLTLLDVRLPETPWYIFTWTGRLIPLSLNLITIPHFPVALVISESRRRWVLFTFLFSSCAVRNSQRRERFSEWASSRYTMLEKLLSHIVMFSQQLTEWMNRGDLGIYRVYAR